MSLIIYDDRHEYDGALRRERLLEAVLPDRCRQSDRRAAFSRRPQAMLGKMNGRLLTGFINFTASDWAQKHTHVSGEDFAGNPLRNRLSILLSRTSHVEYHLGQTA